MARCLKRLTVGLIFAAVVALGTSADAYKTILKVNWASTLKTGKIASTWKLNFATPLVVGENVYVGNSGNYFYGINLKKGKKIWEIKLNGPVLSEPLFDGTLLFVGDGEGYAYAVNSASGDIIWQSFVGEEMMARPAVFGDLVLFATQKNTMVALDKSSGAEKWRNSRPQSISSMKLKGASDPVVIDGKVYVGNNDGVLVIYEAKDGNKVGTVPLAAGRGQFSDIDMTPLKYGGRILVSTMEGVLHSFEMNTFKEMWTLPIGSPNNAAMYEDTVYITAGGNVYALNSTTGETVWKRELDVQELSAPAVSPDYVIIVSTAAKIFVLDRAKGEIIFERYIGGGTFGSPVIADDRLLVLTNSGEVFAFRMK